MNDRPKVITLRGDPVPVEPDEPDEDVVSEIESLLEDARSGDLRGLVFVSAHRNDRYRSNTIGAVISPCAIGMVYTVLQGMTAQMIVDGCDDD